MYYWLAAIISVGCVVIIFECLVTVAKVHARAIDQHNEDAW